MWSVTCSFTLLDCVFMIFVVFLGSTIDYYFEIVQIREWNVISDHLSLAIFQQKSQNRVFFEKNSAKESQKNWSTIFHIFVWISIHAQRWLFYHFIPPRLIHSEIQRFQVVWNLSILSWKFYIASSMSINLWPCICVWLACKGFLI